MTLYGSGRIQFYTQTVGHAQILDQVPGEKSWAMLLYGSGRIQFHTQTVLVMHKSWIKYQVENPKL
jgi:photosystem II stability/assembly factor-like uncharacterized protein